MLAMVYFVYVYLKNGLKFVRTKNDGTFMSSPACGLAWQSQKVHNSNMGDGYDGGKHQTKDQASFPLPSIQSAKRGRSQRDLVGADLTDWGKS